MAVELVEQIGLIGQFAGIVLESQVITSTSGWVGSL